MSWEIKRALTTKELMACLEEDLDLENSNDIEVTYISPDVDEMTDGENIDDNLIEEENIDKDIAGIYEVYAPAESDSDEDNIPLSEISKKKRKYNSKGSKNKINVRPDWQDKR